MNTKQIILIIAFTAIATSETPAQSKLGINYSSYYHFNNNYRTTPDPGANPPISKLTPTWGAGGNIEYQKPLKRNWYYEVGAGLNTSYTHVEVNYPLERFSSIYQPGDYFHVSYNTPKLTHFSLYYKMAKTLNPKNRIKVSPYFSIIALWTTTYIVDYNQSWQYEGRTFITDIVEIDGQSGGYFPSSGIVDRFLSVNPLYGIGVDLEIGLGPKYSPFKERPTSILVSAGYSSLWPFLGDGYSPINVYAKRNDLGIEERLFRQNNYRRLNFNIGVMVPIKRDKVKPNVELSNSN